jgi:acetylglutamate kinase
MVVKLGGSLLAGDARQARVLDAVAANAHDGLVLVHGGGRTIDRFLGNMHVRRRKCHGLRVTDGTTLEVVVAVLAGVVNKALVAQLNCRGVRAVGMTGVDGGTLLARRHPPVDGVDLGFVADTPVASGDLIRRLQRGGFLPVVGSVALGSGGQLLNVNADGAAAALAVALQADQLVFLTDVEGVEDEHGERVNVLTLERAQALADSKAIGGGMKPKLDAAVDALARGVREVRIASPAVDPRLVLQGNGGTRLVAA